MILKNNDHFSKLQKSQTERTSWELLIKHQKEVEWNVIIRKLFKENWLTNLLNEIDTDLSEIWWWDLMNVFGLKYVLTLKSSTCVTEWTRDGAKLQKSSIVEVNQNKKQL